MNYSKKLILPFYDISKNKSGMTAGIILAQPREMVNPAPLLKRRGFVQSSLCTLHPRPDQK